MTDVIDPDDYAEVRQGRTFPYATVGDYVALSDVSDRATRVYWLLRMHVNGGRGDERAWPAQRTLADILKLKKTDTIREAIKELVALGAVEVETVATKKGRANIYTVHEAPPDDFDGLTRLKDYYAHRKAAGQMGSPPAEGAPSNRRRIGGQKTRSNGVTPQTGCMGDAPSDRVDGCTPSGGSELPVVEPPEGTSGGGEVTGVRHLGALLDNPPTPLLKPQPGKPETWLCDWHLANPEPVGADRPPCGACRRVRETCERRMAQIEADEAAAAAHAAADEAERARLCTWHDHAGWVIDPDGNGETLVPAVKCDHKRHPRDVKASVPQPVTVEAASAEARREARRLAGLKEPGSTGWSKPRRSWDRPAKVGA